MNQGLCPEIYVYLHCRFQDPQDGGPVLLRKAGVQKVRLCSVLHKFTKKT